MNADAAQSDPPRMKHLAPTACWMLTIAALQSVSPPSHAADFHVAPAGSDGADGSVADPWQTLKHAAAQVGPGDTGAPRAYVRC